MRGSVQWITGSLCGLVHWWLGLGSVFLVLVVMCPLVVRVNRASKFVGVVFWFICDVDGAEEALERWSLCLVC